MTVNAGNVESSHDRDSAMTIVKQNGRSRREWRRSHALLWVGLGGAAFVIRILILCAGQWGIGPLGDLQGDPDSYQWIAETLAKTGIFAVTSAEGTVEPTAFRPPLYPWLLSWLVVDGELSVPLVAMFHAVLGSLTIVATAAVVQREVSNWGIPLRKATAIALASAILVAFDPLLAMQSTIVMTETLATALAVGAWWLIGIPWRRVSAGFGWTGLILALAVLCRPTFVVWIALLVLYLLVRGSGPKATCEGIPSMRCCEGLSRGWIRFLSISPLFLPSLAVTGLWAARNQEVIGAPIWATTHGGYTLLLGNNPNFYDDIAHRGILETAVFGAPWDPADFHQEWQRRGQVSSREASPLGDREIEEDRAAGEWAKETIREQPQMFLKSCVVRLLSLWSPFPRSLGRETLGIVAWGVGIYYALITVLAGVAVWKHGCRLCNPTWLSSLALVIALSVVHSIYWSNIRMRSPVQPMVIALACIAFVPRRAIGQSGTGQSGTGHRAPGTGQSREPEPVAEHPDF